MYKDYKKLGLLAKEFGISYTTAWFIVKLNNVSKKNKLINTEEFKQYVTKFKQKKD
jgi:hypothetical protein